MAKEWICINYTTFYVNRKFFDTCTALDVVCYTPVFIEYKHRSLLQIYLRVPHGLAPGDECYCFMEPQINLSKSIRQARPEFKLQLTVVKKKDPDYANWVTPKFIGNVEWKYNDLVEYLNTCPGWKARVYDILIDQPELFN